MQRHWQAYSNYALLTLICVIGCTAAQKGPSDELLRTDVTALAAATRFRDADRTFMAVRDVESPARVSLDSMTVVGRALEGDISRVMAIATVVYHSNGARVDCSDVYIPILGQGFASWFAGSRIRCTDGQRIGFSVRLSYRRYDSGWRLESWS